jgi:hypothetical protein
VDGRRASAAATHSTEHSRPSPGDPLIRPGGRFASSADSRSLRTRVVSTARADDFGTYCFRAVSRLLVPSYKERGIPMTDEEKQANREAALVKARATKLKNKLAAEAVLAKYVDSVLPRLDDENRRKVEYINRMLASGRRDSRDEELLKQTRDDIIKRNIREVSND